MRQGEYLKSGIGKKEREEMEMKKIAGLVMGIGLISSVAFAQDMYYRIDSVNVNPKGDIQLNVTFLEGTAEIPMTYNFSGDRISEIPAFLNSEAYKYLIQKKDVESKLANITPGQKVKVTVPVASVVSPVSVVIASDVASGQKIIPVNDTTKLKVGDSVIIKGMDRKEIGVITGIETNKSISLKNGVNYNYTVLEGAKIQR